MKATFHVALGAPGRFPSESGGVSSTEPMPSNAEDFAARVVEIEARGYVVARAWSILPGHTLDEHFASRDALRVPDPFRGRS